MYVCMYVYIYIYICIYIYIYIYIGRLPTGRLCPVDPDAARLAPALTYSYPCPRCTDFAPTLVAKILPQLSWRGFWGESGI